MVTLIFISAAAPVAPPVENKTGAPLPPKDTAKPSTPRLPVPTATTTTATSRATRKLTTTTQSTQQPAASAQGTGRGSFLEKQTY